MRKTDKELLEILKKNWGYDSFRPLQKEIIHSVLDGNDTLGLMPTGGGKSITFQVPALSFESGLTIVVTPLISLMKDQVDNLRRRRVKATSLHSGMTAKERRVAWEMLVNGGTQLLYVTPERLQSERFLMEMRNLKVNLIVVDEAHCISQWGYDFRPAYLNIKKLRKIKPDVPVLALTATATPQVAEDIMQKLEFRSPNSFTQSFQRNNISYLVRKSDIKIYDVVHILSRTTGSAIVYVRSRKKTKEISDYLNEAGISASYYHAGLDKEMKIDHQNRWKKGEIRVMVATNAFGMGIDKPDVRVVIHYSAPPSLEEYYQEAGRAGRDGQRSFAVLLISKTDKALMRRRVTETFPPREVVKKTYEQICLNLHLSVGEGYDAVKEFDIVKFCRLFGHEEKQCRASLNLLAQAGYMQFIEDPDKRSRINILCQREELYDINFQNRTTEKVLAAALRLYTGLFTEFIYINETEIANALKMTNNEVYQALLELDRMKVVSYVPRSGLPMIYMPTSREETHTLLIGKDIYEERKKILSVRTEAMIDYAFSDTSCRVGRMLGYFGEKTASDCGKCDVCRENSKNKNGSGKEEKTLGSILQLLKNHPEGVRYLTIENHCGGDRDAIAKNLSYLCNEGFVRYADNLYFLNENE